MCKAGLQDRAEKLTRLLMWELEANGYSQKDIGDHVGLAEKSINHYKYTKERLPSLPVFIGMVRLGKTYETVKELAEDCECYLIRKPELSGEFSQINECSAKILKETGDVIFEIGKAMEDGKISRKEKAAISVQIDEAVEALLRFREVLNEC